MKWNTGSHLFRVGLIFFLSSILVVCGFGWVFLKNWDEFHNLRSQIISWNLAAHFAEEISPYVDPEINREKLNEIFLRFRRLNPNIHVRVIDDHGRILFGQRMLSFQHDEVVMDVEPISEFLTTPWYPDKPILGSDPLTHPRHGNRTVFSAARLTVEGVPAYVYVALEGHRAAIVERMVGDTSVFWFAVLLFITLALMWNVFGALVLSYLTRKLRDLIRVVKAFREGEQSVRADIKSADELGIFARAFNEMADTIVSQLEQLKQTDQLRRELIASVSHDLRTPLTVIRSQVEAAQESLQEGDIEEGVSLIDRSLLACDRMNDLLGDLFELSKLNAEGFVPECEAFSLDEMIDSYVPNWDSAARLAKLQFSFDAPLHLPLAKGDSKLFGRALDNLVGNAIRYTEAGGEVRVQVHELDNAFEVEVRDTGVGIPKEELSKIYDRFYRATTGRLSSDGSGLGLEIAKRSIEVQGQTLRVESEVGKGTCFSFSLEKESESEPKADGFTHRRVIT